MSKEVYPEWYVDVKSICPNWVTDNILEFLDLKLEDFRWKKVTSIGWWFWIFEMDVAKNWADVTIVDPMFADKDWIDLKLQWNVNWMKGKMKRKIMLKFWEMKKEILETLSEDRSEKEMQEVREKLQWYDDCQREIMEYTRRRELLLDHLENWKINSEKYWLILNTSSGDNIKWVENNSQDFIIIWHTLWHIYNKSSLNVIDFLSESLRLLKSGWKLYIIDYVWDIRELEEFLKRTKLKEYYMVNKWSFVCCFDKKWLSEFLEKELK